MLKTFIIYLRPGKLIRISKVENKTGVYNVFSLDPGRGCPYKRKSFLFRYFAADSTVRHIIVFKFNFREAFIKKV